MRLLVACLVLALGAASMSPGSLAAPLPLDHTFGQVASGATLSVLAPPVEVASGGGAFTPANDGMTLGPGDQVRTTGAGVALLTFFDGSETQLTPDTEVAIQQSTGGQIGLSQLAGTTVDRVQRLSSTPTNFSTDTPAATAFVRGTRYALTVKCYAAPPALPPTRLLTFPRRLSDTPDLLAGQVVYDDGGTLWETRAWQDPDTGQSFDTHEMLGTTYPELADLVYQEDDGSYWLKRTWQDPATGATWDTYENIGVPVDDQTASSLPQVSAVPRFAQAGCHPLTSVVLMEGRVELQPKTGGLQMLDVTPGGAGAISDSATASSPLTRQAIQSFDQATNDLRDVAAARTAAQLGSQVADEFANALVQPGPGGGGGGPGGGLLGGLVAVRSTTASSGLQGSVPPPPPPPVAQAAPVAVATSGPPPPPPPANQVSSPPPPIRSSSSSSSNPGLPPGTVGPEGGTVSLADGSVRVVIPPGAVSQPTAFLIQPSGAPPPPPAGQQILGTPVDLSASSASGAVQTFSPNVQITMTYTGSPPAGMYFFDAGGGGWTRLADSTVDATNNTVTATSSHFTLFGLLSTPETATPTSTSTPTSTPVPTATPSPTPTNTPIPTDTPTPVPSNTATPTATNTPAPTDTPTPTPTSTATPRPTDTPTPKPTATSTQTSTPTPKPTHTSTPRATATPTMKKYPPHGDW